MLAMSDANLVWFGSAVRYPMSLPWDVEANHEPPWASDVVSVEPYNCSAWAKESPIRRPFGVTRLPEASRSPFAAKELYPTN